MKIEIKNLGPISKFTFDVEKDLHLIYGKNSVGKSYAIYCVYILLKKFNGFDIMYFNYQRSLDTLFRGSIDELALKLKRISEENRGKRVSVNEVFSKIFILFFNKVFSNEITESFNNTFSSINELKNIYSNKKPEIKITSNGICLILSLDKLNNIIAKEIIWLTPIDIFIAKGAKKYLLYFGQDLELNSIAMDENLGFTSMNIMSIFTGSAKYLLNNIYFLPSSRSGLYLALNSFSPIIAELSKHRFQLQNKIELPSLSEPISDYFLQLSNTNSKQVSTQFTSIIKQFEEDILQGTVSIDDKNKKILFQPIGSKFKMDLSATSSMISEIAPIVTYFKHIINIPQNAKIITLAGDKAPKSIIFIEEPEAHLHPEIQVRLMEIFAELTKHNMKVVITSHSNYMFNKLVNMILAKKVDVDKVVVNNMVMTKLGSVVDENMTVTEDGVEDFNFSQTSEKLYEERMNIVD